MTHSRLNAVFIAHRPCLLRTVQRLVDNPNTAEDLVQDTYLRVRQALGRSEIDHLEPFVFRTARNLALDHLRARRVRQRTLIDAVPWAVVQAVTAQASPLAEAAHAQRLLVRLGTRIAQLTPRQQQIFSLSRLQGRTNAQIASRLQVSASTVQKELKLVMAFCKEMALPADDLSGTSPLM